MRSPEEYLNNPPPISPRVTNTLERIAFSIRQDKARCGGWGSINSDAMDRPMIVRKAMAEAKKLREVPKHLWEDQLLAGSFAFYDPALMLDGAFPVYYTEDEKDEAARQGQSPSSIFGHIVPYYKMLLDKGIKGLLEDIEARRKQGVDARGEDFLTACEISLHGLADFAAGYAEVCRAEAARNPENAATLALMAENLDTCPLNPPESFHQAVQAVWLAHIAHQLTGNALAMGRVDQYLYPYFERDLEDGTLDEAQAQELCDLFLLKYNERTLDTEMRRVNADLEAIQQAKDALWSKRSPFDRAQQHSNVRDDIDATNHWLQNIVLGGMRPDGSDGSTQLTAMFLIAFDRIKKTNPVVTARVGTPSPDWYVDAVARFLKTGGGMPAMFNDDNIIPALTRHHGVDEEDARDYTNDGCWEIIVPGRTDFWFYKINMLKCIELALNHGKSMLDGKQETPDFGDPDLFDEAAFTDALHKTVEYIIDGIMERVTRTMHLKHIIAPVPLLSAMLAGPLENARDLAEQGARYTTCGLIAEAMSYAIDSLWAIKKHIAGGTAASFGELAHAMRCDFAGHDDLRALLSKNERYGNADPAVDAVGEELITWYAAAIERLNARYPSVRFMPGAGTFSWYIAVGEGTGASAEGRPAKAQVASNFAPSAGAMKRGVTAAIASHARMRTDLLTVGAPLDLGLAERYVTGEEGTRRLSGLIRAFVELGGNMLTLTVSDAATLRRAQENPEQYRDLRVRMGGWSAYFTMLSKEQQEHHIGKAEMGVF